jgi:hypothetical protein
MSKAAFFHGLESPPRSEKNDVMERVFSEVFAPPMDYRDSRLFDETLKSVKEFQPDILIGSSMGGWFAYCISTLTGIPTLLFNPAVHGRTFDPRVKIGSISAKHTVVLGKDDKVIDPSKTIDWFSKNGVGRARFNLAQMEHRIPIDIFMRWIKSPLVTSRLSESFDEWMKLNHEQ